jgi:hypothetical protein
MGNCALRWKFFQEIILGLFSVDLGFKLLIFFLDFPGLFKFKISIVFRPAKLVDRHIEYQIIKAEVN